MQAKSKKFQSPFNGPLESSLRSLFLLAYLTPRRCTLQEVIYLDYLLVHSGDADGPDSLHPDVPHRGGEWMVRKELIEEGLFLVVSRELVIKHFSDDGIRYSASDLGCSLLKHFHSEYSKRLVERAQWLTDNSATRTEQELQKIVLTNVGSWGTEFTRESTVRSGPLG